MMSTPRPLLWFVLFLVTLPIVTATAHGVERAAEGELMISIGDIHEGERVVYDLYVSSLYHEHEATYEDWLSIEVGAPTTYTRVDGVSVEAVPVTLAQQGIPWDWTDDPSRPVELSNIQTQWISLADGTYQGNLWRTENLYVSEDSDGQQESERIIMRNERPPENIGGSMFWRGYQPLEQLYTGPLFGYIVLAVAGLADGHAPNTGTHEGETVYDVRGYHHEGTTTSVQPRCDLQYPEVDYTDFRLQQTFGDRSMATDVRDSVWYANGEAFPRAATCESTYSDGGKLIERIELRLERSDYVAGGKAVDVNWNQARQYAQSRVVLPLTPTAQLGFPSASQRLFSFPVEDALEALQGVDDDEAAAFLAKPYAYWYATYHPFVVSREGAEEASSPGEVPAPAVPIPLPMNPPVPNNAPATGEAIERMWRFELINEDADRMSFVVRRNESAQGVERPWVSAWDAGPDPGWTIAETSLPKRAVSMDAMMGHFLDLRGISMQEWEMDQNASFAVRQSEQLRADAPSPIWVRATVGASGTATQSSEGYSQFRQEYNPIDGTVGDRTLTGRADETAATAPPGPTPAPATSSSLVVHDSFPAAATASGLALAAGFAVTYFWDGITRGVVAPLYAKISKDKVLDHRRREEIEAYVAANPGANVMGIKRHLAAGYGTTVHHLETLERNKVLTSKKVGRTRCYFPAGTLDPAAMTGAAAASSPAAQRFLQTIAEVPGITQQEIADRLGLSPSSVRYQAKRLSEYNQVRVERDGKLVRYYVAGAAA